MELAIINGTYRDSNTKVAAAAGTVCRTCISLCALESREREIGGRGFQEYSSRNKRVI